MTRLSNTELTDLLASNPDLSVDDPWIGAPTVQPVQAIITSEHDLQAAIIAECDRRSMGNPAWGMVFSIPNGGHRHPAVAAKLKAEGVRAGIPDLFVALPRHDYAGMFLELKFGKNKPTGEQWNWTRRLRDAGYFVDVAWDFETAMRLLTWYVELETVDMPEQMCLNRASE